VENRVFEPDDHEGPSTLASSEATAFASNENLDTDGKQKEHGRHQRFQDHANKVALGLLWAVAVFTLMGMTIYVWHIIVPETWRWLPQNSLDGIRTLLTGVLFSSAMSGYINKRMAS
jgi:hypothetical protein